MASCLVSILFQSSPDPEAGCNLANNATSIRHKPSIAFQSSPDPEAGCNVAYYK